MAHHNPRLITALLSLLLVITSLLTLAASLPAQAAADDTPAPVITDNLQQWSVGAGGQVLWWATNCYGNENPGPGVNATLKRKVVGGSQVSTVQSISGPGHCNTYFDQLASNDNAFAPVNGLYYYNQSDLQIMHMPLNAPFTPNVVKTLSSDQAPVRHFVEASDPLHPGDFIYWAAPDVKKILRVHKNGSGNIETVADTELNPLDVLVVGTTVFWSDSTGVHSISISCASLPCANTGTSYDQFRGNTYAYGLLFQTVPPTGKFHIFGFRIYWVQVYQNGQHNDYKINYRFCRQDVPIVCFILPPENQVAPPPPNFYTGTTDQKIGDLLLADNNVYWTEASTLFQEVPVGDIKRKADNAPDSDQPATIATSQTNIDARLFVANDGQNLDFARVGSVSDGAGIYSLSLNASPIQRDVQVSLPELGQALLGAGNNPSIPLVADKTTYVRAYGHLRSGPTAPIVEARLFGTKDNQSLPGSPLKPVNGTRALFSGVSDPQAERVSQRTQLNGGWDFLLPASWISAGTINLRVEIDPRHVLDDPNLDDNASSLNVTFQEQPPMCVWTVPVRTDNPLPSVYDPNVGAMFGRFKQMWPIPDVWVYQDTDPVEELEVCTWHYVPYPCHGPYELTDQGTLGIVSDNFKVLFSLWERATLSFNPDECDDAGAPTDFMGMVSPDADSGNVVDYASTFSSQSWVKLPAHDPSPIPPGWDQLREGASMAQALGANEGRGQLGCGTNALSTEYDANYPYPDCQIGKPVTSTNPDDPLGFDVATRRPINTNEADDFMSSSSKRWISDYTWRGLFDEFAAASAASTAANQANPDASGNSVFVSGMVNVAHKSGEIATVLTLPTGSVPPATRQSLNVQSAAIDSPDATTVFSLRLLDPKAAILLTRTLTLNSLNTVSDALFSTLFTPPAGQVAKIELLANNTVIDTRSPGVHSPAASIQQPAAGAIIDNQLTIKWNANDPDKDDRLLFTVQYSHDNGQSWHTLAIDLPSTPDPNNTFTLNNLGSLHGSAPNSALIRVLASDGYNTAIATSKPFTLKNRPPLPLILSPSQGQTYAGGDSVALQGTATDPEDGGLPSNALNWRVDGTSYGNGAEVNVDGLPSGAHTAALAATDSNTQTVTTTVNFTLAPLSISQTTTPTLDGLCDDAAYAQGVDLQLQPYGDGSQATVSLLRSDDFLWACFSGLAFGPADSTAYVGLHIDIDNSRDANAQPTDTGFFLGENGGISTTVGNGAGGFNVTVPSGFQAGMHGGATAWSAELRIDKATLGGWDHLVGLSAGHYSLTHASDDYLWPYHAQVAKPTTWSPAALGSQPLLIALDPVTATVLGPSFVLSVTGSSFVTGTTIFWNNSVLPTTYLDSTHLKAQVAAAQLQSAALISVTAHAGHIVSNPLPFIVEAPAPKIKSLSPDNADSEAAALTLTVNGSNFAQNAQVLWNGAPLATQFINSTQLKAQVSAAQLFNGRIIGVAVSNPQPNERLSPIVPFEVKSTKPGEPPSGANLFLPTLSR